MVNQVGGIIINGGMNRRDAFMIFRKDSTCQLFSHTTIGGILFRFTLNQGVESPYSTNRSNYPQMEVRELMIKLLILNEDSKRFDIVTYGNPIIDLHPTSQMDFMLERINNQLIYKKLIFYRLSKGLSADYL